MRNLDGLALGWGWNKKEKIEKTCKCGVIFYVKPSLDRVTSCSRSCAKKGTVSGNKGKQASEATRLKQRLAKLGKTGLLCPNYIVDRSLLKLEEKRNDSAYKEWRKEVWVRDGFKCRIADNNCNGRIEAHHILSWSEHSELRYKINNGITLCHAHHPRKRAEEKRLIPTFTELVSMSVSK